MSSSDAGQKNSPTSCKQVKPTHADTVVSSRSTKKKQPVTKTVRTDTEKADRSSSFTATVMTTEDSTSVADVDENPTVAPNDSPVRETDDV